MNIEQRLLSSSKRTDCLTKISIAIQRSRSSKNVFVK